MFVNDLGFILSGLCLGRDQTGSKKRMNRVEADIDELRSSVVELRSSLYRAGQAQQRVGEATELSFRTNMAATILLAMLFLLM